MTYKGYAIEIDANSEFDLAFTGYARDSPRRAAALILALEAFERGPEQAGEFLRGNGARAIYIVPIRRHGEADDGAFVLVELDREAGTIRPMRFLQPQRDRNWAEQVEWAERFLGV